MKEIKDEYGKKIGGSRRDLSRGIMVSDLYDMNAVEKTKYVIKDNIFPKPDYQALKDEGIDVEVVYFIKTVRDSLAVRPVAGYAGPSDEDIALYVEGMNKVKDLVMALRKKEEIVDFRYKILKNDYFVPAESQGWFTIKPNRVVYLLGGSKFIAAVQTTQSKMSLAVKKKRFLYSALDNALADIRPVYYQVTGREDEFLETYNHKDTDCMYHTCYGSTLISGLTVDDACKIPVGRWILCLNYLYAGNFETKEDAEKAAVSIAEAKSALKPTTGTTNTRKGKKTFTYQTLTNLRQSENGYPMTVNGMPVVGITGEQIVEEFNFWGSEFGNYLNQDERQKNLDLSYVSFANIARVFGIKNSDISLGGKLSIAYGARGRGGNALAHFEPARNVCNLTKLRGAGSLFHEYFHFWDWAMGAEYGLGGSLFELADKGRSYKLASVCPEAYEVFIAMTRKEDGTNTDLLNNSIKMDGHYAKQGGYWASVVELWARCGACWAKDRLMQKFGIVDDYLVGHADMAVGYDNDSNIIRAYPIGEEREKINKAIDKLVSVFFHSAEASATPSLEKVITDDLMSIIANAQETAEAATA